MLEDDHFYRQFDRYPEGEERLQAACRHISWVINQTSSDKWMLIGNVQTALDFVLDGKIGHAALQLKEIVDDNPVH